MGVLPLQFKQGDGRASLNLSGDEIIDVRLPDGVSDIVPRQDIELVVRDGDSARSVMVTSRLDTENEIAYFQSGGILQFVLNNLVQAAA